MEQTAVEWLENKIEDQRENGNDDLRTTLHYCKQAKEMEKQQQGYSEEEVKKLIKDFLFERGIGKEVQNVNEWFEQNKNK